MTMNQTDMMTIELASAHVPPYDKEYPNVDLDILAFQHENGMVSDSDEEDAALLWPKHGLRATKDLSGAYRRGDTPRDLLFYKRAVTSVEKAVDFENQDRLQLMRIALAQEHPIIHPPDTIPPILFAYPATHLSRIPAPNRNAWIDVPGRKCFMHIFDTLPETNIQTYNDWWRRSVSRAEEALSTIRTWTGNNKIFIKIPRPNEANIASSEHTRIFLVTHLREPDLAKLITAQVISSKLGTYSFFPFAIEMPRLIILLSGFNHGTSAQDVINIVKRAWQTMATRIRIENILGSTQNDDLSDSTVVDDWARSIGVTEHVYTSHTVFSVHADPVSTDEDTLSLFRYAVRRVTYIHTHHGIGRILPFTYCTTCGANDHSASVCPYPRMTTWTDPAETSTPSQELDGRVDTWGRWGNDTIGELAETEA
jgi:hypothetical protein